MSIGLSPRTRGLAAAAVAASCGGTPASSPPPADNRPLSTRVVLETGGESSIRLAVDPVGRSLYFCKRDGGIYQVQTAGTVFSARLVHTAAETGVVEPSGMAFGPDGTLYLVDNETRGNTNVATIRKGVRRPAGDGRTWSTLARTAPYPRSNSTYDHVFNGIAVSPDGRSVFLSSGSRTDHGEVQSAGGAFPGAREVPLTAKMFRLPADAEGVLLPNDEAALDAAGYTFARGLRNAFDPAFGPSGDLFSTENSGDRDDPDELNWIQQGRHYGYPWRMGGNATPQQFAGYDPRADRLLNPGFRAVQQGYFHNDPGYPSPAGLTFTEPIQNLGPDADRIRDPLTGAVFDAGDRGTTLGTFTSHRSPLGLVFDVRGVLPGELRGAGFVLGWTRGDAGGDTIAGPFRDAGEDLLHLTLTRSGADYRLRAKRLVCGFRNPIDAEIFDGRLYVLEWGGTGALVEVSLPSSLPAECGSVAR